MKLTKKEIKELEKKFGAHGFCHICGNTDLKPVEDAHLYPSDYRSCPKCGSSDADE